MFTPEMKVLTTAVMNDKNTKTSRRVMSALYYVTIRACEIIDWWFPTEYEKLQRKRAKEYLKDPPNIPKGATIEIDPTTGAAINTSESTASPGQQ
jgi:hypothetical protein